MSRSIRLHKDRTTKIKALSNQRYPANYLEISIHLLLWFFFLSVVNVTWTADWFDPSLRLNRPAPLSIVAFILFFYFNAFYLIPRFLNRKPRFWYFIIAPLVIAGMEFSRLLIYYFMGAPEAAFMAYAKTELWSRDSFLFAPISPLPAAFFLSFGYRFTKDWFVNQRRIERLETDKIRTELQQLKAQINPHFLFNNLNTLDGLIEKDPALAQTYLHKMAALYRYVLANSEQELVPLEKELAFAQQYIFLLENRFGGAYQFQQNFDTPPKKAYLIPPTSLQTLIENVVKHNQGTPEAPLLTTIKIQGKVIEICHLKKPKFQVNTKLGTGLKNLNTRYQLISGKEITILDTPDSFTVQLPLIPQVS